MYVCVWVFELKTKKHTQTSRRHLYPHFPRCKSTSISLGYHGDCLRDWWKVEEKWYHGMCECVCVWPGSVLINIKFIRQSRLHNGNNASFQPVPDVNVCMCVCVCRDLGEQFRGTEREKQFWNSYNQKHAHFTCISWKQKKTKTWNRKGFLFGALPIMLAFTRQTSWQDRQNNREK